MQLSSHQEIIAEHVAKNVGPIQGIVTIPQTELALLHVPATEHKPFQLLITAGMSANPMPIPDDEPENPSRIELSIGLPPEWPVEQPESKHSWPLNLLANLAQFPQAYNAWLGVGHTIPHGQPMRPYDPSTQLCCALIAPSLVLTPEAQEITIQNSTANIRAIVPLFEREVDLKLEEDANSLFHRLDQHKISEVLNPNRRSVAGALLDLLDQQSV